MKVPYGEGIASRTGPEPCAIDREVGGEASAGGGIGQPLSREKCNRDADAFEVAEGKTDARVIASARPVPRGRRPWPVPKCLVWKPGDLIFGRRRIMAVRIGKVTSQSR